MRWQNILKERFVAVSPYLGTNADIEEIAQSVLDAVKATRLRGRSLLNKIVDLTGGTVEVVEDPSQQEVDGGSLVIRGKSDYSICLSPYTTPLRDNFTIAHELGHYFLHFFLKMPAPDVPLCFTRYGTGPIEWQANRFAAALLMPAGLFREKHEAYSGDEFCLSGFFDVSRAAIQARREALDCSVT